MPGRLPPDRAGARLTGPVPRSGGACEDGNHARVGGARVLIVEDEAALSAAPAEGLQKDGFTVEAVGEA